MPGFKLVISDPKSGKSYQREADEKATKALIGRKIGDAVKGEHIGLAGYEFEVTGGSDYCGFPMRRDVAGTERKRILSVGPTVGIRSRERGIKQRKTVCGNTIHARIAQVNLKVVKEGKEKLAQEAEPKEKEKKPKEGKPEKPEKPKKEKPSEAKKQGEDAEAKKEPEKAAGNKEGETPEKAEPEKDKTEADKEKQESK
ncbi:30S ribosomal protein S6e [Candidatus Woesearchaeota archaeon CG08_land_8_20_14_0_20_47_9]|nr:MAG: 30S ribosomal protein S6e [Candidatus Woesearchaeota archaeon CG10_big_fil_rev_8_21_14_0_10_47_5]PIO04025.1 MAG: 30S ribosomal protein S6e [Candidatus Woesearchaeota archaeon CG08_land_8_20_14_0_20_47_9]HII30364.1 30S ribosomal protein S6e [Candidatus Woesearchaeota archaeon]